jgi:hypothetical protein
MIQVMQMHLMFADNIVVPHSDNALWDQAIASTLSSPCHGSRHQHDII